MEAANERPQFDPLRLRPDTKDECRGNPNKGTEGMRVTPTPESYPKVSEVQGPKDRQSDRETKELWQSPRLACICITKAPVDNDNHTLR